MKNLSRLVALSFGIALGLSACAPGAGPAEVRSTVQAGIVTGRVDDDRTAEVVAYRYSLAVRGEGTLLADFERRAVNELAGVVVVDQTADTNALRHGLAEGLVAVSPRTGRYYYDAEGVAAGRAILNDLANQTPELVTVTFARTADGERVTIACLGGQPPWVRVFGAAELRDPVTCIDDLLDEVRRQVDVFRSPQP